MWSLYNDTPGQSVQPTPAIGGVGLFTDAGKRVGLGFTEVGHSILLIGDTRGHLGSSLYLRELLASEEGTPPPVDLAVEKLHGRMVQRLIQAGLVKSCHDLSDGGLLVALAEMCVGTGIGAQIRFQTDVPAHAYAFGEDQGRYLIACDAMDKDALMVQLNQADIRFTDLGTTIADLLIVEDQMRVPVATLRDIHETWLPGFMAA